MADEAAAAAAPAPPPRRQLRERTRKLYSDDWAFGDEDFEGRRGFQVEEKIESDRYDLGNFNGLFREMTGPELTVAYLQKHGLGIPLLVREKTGLGLRVPSTNFTVNDVRTCVGSKRIVDVMDVNTQKNEDMTMKEWQKYYEDDNKDRLLNVISLEFSHTKLENYVQSPTIVRQIDWVDVVWPKHLKEAQVESTNLLEDMMYPKVQKYCLMSVKGCYTDFHVDFGGTSVWYHILKGGKIFWLIPPTEKNLALYQEWVLSGKQSDIFFGDMVDRCGRITLHAGMTLFIPTGWIHAVYTPQDSLVFGGNFLHSFGIDKQLRVAQVEEATKVPHKFRYPFFTEMLWYVLERYVHVLLGRSHLDISGTSSQHMVPENLKHVHLTPLELHGLKSIVMYLHSLPSTKKNVPELIRDPVALIHDVRCLVEQHRHDSPESAVTGHPVLPPPPALTITEREKLGITRKKLIRPPLQERSDSKSCPRRRRTRCKKCEACTRADCGECAYCQDMVKFGGTGRAKQTCLMRQCLRPMLPVTASCKFCSLDGWGQPPAPLMGKQHPVTPSSLMECSICYDIVHPQCTNRNMQNIVVSDDLPNSWECPECCESGRNLESKPRQLKAGKRKLSVTSASVSIQPPDSEKAMTPSKKMQVDLSESWNDQEVAEGHQRTYPQNQQTSPIVNRTPVSLIKKQFPVARNIQAVPVHRSNDFHEQSYVYNKVAILSVFKYLSRKDLVNCALVCRTWAQFGIDPSLWKKIDVSHSVLSAGHLSGIAQRQPETLLLDWTNIAKRQLAWLLIRLTKLQNLSLKGCNWAGVYALNTSACPLLTTLDLSFVAGLNDSSLREILSPPTDSGAGLIEKSSRLRYLRTLSLCGCDISDVALRYIAQHLSYVRTLNLSSCARITDAGVAQLTSPPAATVTTLVSLNLSGCRHITEISLNYLLKCQALKHLDLRNTLPISAQRVASFKTMSSVSSLLADTSPMGEANHSHIMEVRPPQSSMEMRTNFEDNIAKRSVISNSYQLFDRQR
ncbi:jmjC domain-containing histone demethylation protein 1 [Nasonia vitripennis]|uniref:[histone H3]-dimethyl-L-lysine(36) demethylase n=1 Tax=Nasonia vitripennis TaxID=7425 RepID=A0A7M7G754_NASVI|nr:jmjC domain-containing histone demethylation protein 1 [Nasonia vitripennis]